MGSEQLSIDGLHRGDNATFEKLFDAYYHPLCKTVSLLLKNFNEGPNDYVLHAFVKLFEKRLEIESMEHARRFLYVTAINKCKNFIRSKKRQKVFLNGYTQVVDHCYNPLTPEFDQQKALDLIKSEMVSLPQRTRRVLELYYFHQMPLIDISLALGIPYTIAKKCNERGKKYISKNLKVSEFNLIAEV